MNMGVKKKIGKEPIKEKTARHSTLFPVMRRMLHQLGAWRLYTDPLSSHSHYC